VTVRVVDQHAESTDSPLMQFDRSINQRDGCQGADA